MTFVAKTVTLEPNKGNLIVDPTDGYTVRQWRQECIHVSPRSWWNGVAINKVGLTNVGLKATLDLGHWQTRTKPFMISFMSIKPTADERIRELEAAVRILLAYLREFRAPVALQINLSCPNVGIDHDDGFVEEAMRTLNAAARLGIPILLKIDALASIYDLMVIEGHPALDGIVTSNTIKFGTAIEGVDWERLYGFKVSPLEKVGKPGTGGGGASGAILFPLVESQVTRVRAAGFRKAIQAGGGVRGLDHVRRLKLARADSVFIASQAILEPWNVASTIRGANHVFGGNVMITEFDRDTGTALRITMRKPDNWHNHFRHPGDPRFDATVAYIARQFARANGMGNTPEPITTAELLIAYRRAIVESATRAGFPGFEPMLVGMMTPDTTPRVVEDIFDAGAYAMKTMPANGTTGSSHGVFDYRARRYRECMAVVRDRQKASLVHAEVPDQTVPMAVRERLFIPILDDIRDELPDLKICVEHISDEKMVQYVLDGGEHVSATVTPHHMEVTHQDADDDPHLQCMPYPKGVADCAMVRSGAMFHPRFFYGSDNAPHLRPTKERTDPKPAFGVFTAPVELAAIVEIFERDGQLDKLESFLSERGARWHGIPLNEGMITLVRDPWTVPDVIDLGNGNEIVPYKHGQTLNWKLVE